MSHSFSQSWLGRGLRGLIDLRVIVLLVFALLVLAGISASPFDKPIKGLPDNSVAVDAIPNLGDNQQIVFTSWPGRSPRDVEEQLTYPLTTALLGIPKVKSVRSQSMFGFSSIYVIFEEDAGFYWSRSRLLEKLSSLPKDLMPPDVEPTLGPDATGLGQVFMYTLEGHNEEGKVVGGWSLDELRSVQDWTIRYALQAVPGVSEVSSIGGHVKEYQVDVNPEALLAHQVTLEQVANAVRHSNHEVGARTLEINRAEYVLRSRGFVSDLSELEESVVAVRGHVPIRVSDVARVSVGPVERRGALDDSGAEAVGGIVVARYGSNPIEVIEGVRARIETLSKGLPTKILEDGTRSTIAIVPYYDRSELIYDTLGTLSTALWQQVLITILVVIIMLRRLRSALLVSFALPMAVFLSFLGMKLTGIEANVMSLAGIAIAIGTMVDMGIVIVESIVRHLETDEGQGATADLVAGATAEVAPAVLTSAATTVVSFLPVFAMTAAEGRLFRPLAFTKSYALIGAALLAVVLIPVLAPMVLQRHQAGSDRPDGALARTLRAFRQPKNRYDIATVVLVVLGVLLFVALMRATGLSGVALLWTGVAFFVLLGGLPRFVAPFVPKRARPLLSWSEIAVACGGVAILLSRDWQPLGQGEGDAANLGFVLVLLAFVLGTLSLFRYYYPRLLEIVLRQKALFLALPVSMVVLGTAAWIGSEGLRDKLPGGLGSALAPESLDETFPGLGSEFMPSLDEGSFLYMPTTTPHASVGQALEQLRLMDAAIATIPEVKSVVGKLGRADSALDPAPVSMFESIVTYEEEWGRNEEGERVRLWRDHIHSPDDIWKEILKVATMPGLTTAPKLMPIETRQIMLQTGMRAPIGLKIFGDDLVAMERAGRRIERLLEAVEGVDANTVSLDQVVGKPYIEIDLDRAAIARFGLTVNDVQQTLQLALGGVSLTKTVEGRERYPVRVRYMREERDSLEAIGRVMIAGRGGEQVPLAQLATIEYAKGPQSIRSEDAFRVAYLTFDTLEGASQVQVVRRAEEALSDALESGSLVLPEGVSHYAFAGNYENQLHSEERLRLLVPIALILVVILLYLQFRRISTVLIVFSGVLSAIAGAFILLWLFAQPWFLDIDLMGADMRELFHVGHRKMSSAVWVGIIALIGIATDDGVVMGLYLKQEFARQRPSSIEEIRACVSRAGRMRIRACLMTTATTLLALLPVLSSSGRGADVMIPMAIPIAGGMFFALISLFVVPVLYAWVEEWKVS